MVMEMLMLTKVLRFGGSRVVIVGSKEGGNISEGGRMDTLVIWCTTRV